MVAGELARQLVPPPGKRIVPSGGAAVEQLIGLGEAEVVEATSAATLSATVAAAGRIIMLVAIAT